MSYDFDAPFIWNEQEDKKLLGGLFPQNAELLTGVPGGSGLSLNMPKLESGNIFYVPGLKLDNNLNEADDERFPDTLSRRYLKSLFIDYFSAFWTTSFIGKAMTNFRFD